MSFLTGDQIGSFAELLAMTDLSRPVVGRYRRPLFRATSLGAKYPAVDFLIDVLDANDNSQGFFFAQVKGTSKNLAADARLAVHVELESFNRLVQVPVSDRRGRQCRGVVPRCRLSNAGQQCVQHHTGFPFGGPDG
jgi:hypothetical protein